MEFRLVIVPAIMTLLVIPREVIWSYTVGGAVLAIGLMAIGERREDSTS